jgi:hypothetical protein
MPKFTKSENGQAIILLVMAIVGLFGFAALSIDGGMIFSDRRIAQNAADSSALAGARKAGEMLNANNGWICPQSQAENAAIASALSNDFSISSNPDASQPTVANGVTAYCNQAENYVDVLAKITTETPTAFAHFVFGGQLQSTVEAVARVYGPAPVTGDTALLALDTDCKKPLEGGIELSGSFTLTVDGGSIHSNCDLTTNGTKGTVDVVSGTITYNQDYGVYSDNGNMDVTPSVQGSHDVLDVSIPPPDCDVFAGSPSNVSGSATLSPGKYNNISVTNQGELLELDPGLYCIYGDFKATGGELIGEGVTLYFPPSAGTFNTQGNITVTLTAPQPPLCEYQNPPVDGCPPAIGGMLIYYEPGGHPSSPDIKLGGTSASTYEGMIFAPNTAVNVGGASDLEDITYGISIVAFHIDIYGNSNIDITYDADLMPHYPTNMQMYQ